jgi:hypothetical protein
LLIETPLNENKPKKTVFVEQVFPREDRRAARPKSDMADQELVAKQDAHAALISLNPRGEDQIHLIDFLRSVSESATSADDLLLRLREVCLPDVIAKKTITNNPILFLAIRQLMTAYGIQVRRVTGLPVIRGVLEALFVDDEESFNEAVQIWKARSQETIHPDVAHSPNFPLYPVVEAPPRSNNSASRNANDVSKRFPHAQKFSGKMGEPPSFSEIKNQFMDVIEELEIPPVQQVTLLRSALREEAYQFYQDVIKDKVGTLGEAFKLLEDTYASIARQEQIKTILQSLSSKFQGSDQSPLVTLNDIYSDISRLAVQCSTKYRDDQSKADFLKSAVEKQSWARGAVEEYLSNPASFMPNKFQGFHGRLTAALTACAAAGDLSTATVIPSTQTESMSMFPTHFGSTYGVRTSPRTPASTSSLSRKQNTNISPRLSDAEWKRLTPDEKKLRRTCYKCGQKGHYSGDPSCSRYETSMTDAIKARYRESGNNPVAASTILFEIAVSLDEKSRETRFENEPIGINFFNHLVDEYNEIEPTIQSNDGDDMNFGQPSIE